MMTIKKLKEILNSVDENKRLVFEDEAMNEYWAEFADQTDDKLVVYIRS